MVSCLSLVLAGTVASCTQATVLKPQKEEEGHSEEVAFDSYRHDLGTFLFSVSVNPQSSNFTGEGEVLIVEEDGELVSIATHGMDLGRVLWGPSGLFFSDITSDYLVGTDMTSVETTRPNHQTAAFQVEGRKFVSIYNDGVYDDVYIHRVVRTDGDKSSMHAIEGFVWSAALCDGDVFGVVEKGEFIGEEATNEFDLSLELLSSQDDSTPAPHTLTYKGGLTQQIGPVECVDDTLYWFANLQDFRVSSGGRVDFAEPLSGPTLLSWDSQTGSFDAMPVQSETPQDRISPVLVERMIYGPGAIYDGRVGWIGGDGAMRETNLDSGMTKQSGRLPLSGMPAGLLGVDNFALAAFDSECVWILDVPSSADEFAFRLASFNREDGTMTHHVTVKGLAEPLGIDRVARSIAVNPAIGQC